MIRLVIARNDCGGCERSRRKGGETDYQNETTNSGAKEANHADSYEATPLRKKKELDQGALGGR
jgi:hypothetical protein